LPTELLGEAEEGFVDLAFDARVIDGALQAEAVS
jgi:hypothetical protein